jgi:taurine dioxygenase
MSEAATFQITPTGARVGASVDGIDLRRGIDEATFRKINAAYCEFGVLVFRDQDLTEDQLIAFTGRFGEVERYVRNHYALPGYAEILVVSNVVENGRNVGLADAGATWHTDMSYIPAPPRGTVLHAREIPVEDGKPLGDTLFSSTAAAYDDLPDDLKRRLDGARTTHSYEAKHARRAREGKSNRKPLSEAERAALPPVDHPVIRRHPVTGRKCIYVVAGECTGITGMSDADAEPLLESLAERCTRPQYVYRHRWRRGDVVMWDNCLVQHLAIQDYALPQRRLIWRTTVNGTIPV